MRMLGALLALALGSPLTWANDQPIPPKEAPGKMTVPPGFQVTLFAGEPDIVQPIAFTFDDRGRMWVVECLSYPNWSRDGTGKDRVVILEDTNGDGTHDRRTVFLDNGVNLSGIELGFGGVWLCSSPNLLFVPILAGDKPGKPEVVLDGWNMIDTKHNIFNSLTWGPDGWLYGCNGIQAKAWVGPPGTPREKRAYLDCGVWRYHPTRKLFQPVAHGTTNPFGLDFDDHGELFITNCVIDHLFHFVPGGHYERMYGQDANPHVYGLLKSCVDYKHWAGGDWTSSRSTGVGGKPEHSDFGGGHAHSGCAIYLGENFPAEYRNTLFTCNIHGNRLNNDGLVRTPAGMKGVRRPDFLFANDSWFRGICVKVGPEGALYVSDWTDTGECHNYDKADTTNGRIYRVSYGKPKSFTTNVATLSDAELVQAQTSKNEWLVRKARRVLQERAAAGKLQPDTAAQLWGLFEKQTNAAVRLRALWAAAAITEKRSEARWHDLVTDKDKVVRVWGYRLAEDQWPAKAGVLEKEQSPFVLAAAASAIQFTNAFPRAWHDGAEPLLRHKLVAADPYLSQLLWYAIEKIIREFPGNRVELLTAVIAGIPDTPPAIRANAIRYLIVTNETRTGIGLALRAPAAARDNRDAIVLDVLRGIRQELTGRKPIDPPAEWTRSSENYLRSPSAAIRREAEAVAVLFGDRSAIDRLTTRVTDPQSDPLDRRAAIELLLSRKQPDFGNTLRALLNDPAVRQAAVRGLAAFPDAETPAAILKAYSHFTAEEKADAVQTLAARVPWANALLDAIEAKQLPRADVSITVARQIQALNDKALSKRLETVWGKITPASTERAALIQKWKALLTEPALARANPVRGKSLFTQHCATCHKLFGEGGSVGPELTGSQRANLDYVLENVLDPSAVVPSEYRLVNFTTADERLVSGIIVRETKDAVTIHTGRDTVVLATADIIARKPTNLSLMPDGLFDQMTPDDVRDLVAYLRAKEQVKGP
jgi:putative membrane-bound dehydrogenase-like protein